MKQESRKAPLREETKRSEDERLSQQGEFRTCACSTIGTQDGNQRQRLAIPSSSQTSSVFATFETECALNKKASGGANNNAPNHIKTLVFSFLVLAIAASAATQARVYTANESCNEDAFRPTGLLLFVVLSISAGICDAHPAQHTVHEHLPNPRRALNLVAIVLFLLATVGIDDTKPKHETCATFAYSADTGDCPSNISTMNGYWKEMQLRRQPTSHIFINAT